MGIFINCYIILFGRLEYALFVGLHLVLLLPLIFVIIFRKSKSLFIHPLLYYPAFVIAPYFFLFQLITVFKRLRSLGQKFAFVSSSVLTLTISVCLCYQISAIFKKVEASGNFPATLSELSKNPINRYLIELILGSHWKYHTELCVVYDGWRPPFHDPVLVISNALLFPNQTFAKGTKLFFMPNIAPKDTNNFLLYKQLYPENPTSFYCRCGIDERLTAD
jgi:hypothetical protein